MNCKIVLLGAVMFVIGGVAMAQQAAKSAATPQQAQLQPRKSSKAPSKASPAAPESAPSAAASAAPPAAPTAPIGLGEIKVGMTLEAIESVAINGSNPALRLTQAPVLDVVDPKYPLGPGETRYKATVAIGGLAQPVPITLRFKAGKLVVIHILFEDAVERYFDVIKTQISGKYGEPVLKDDRREEDCIYRNGSSFKIKSGTVTMTWSTPSEIGFPVETTMTDLVMQSCPSNLSNGMFSLKIKSLTIQLRDEPKAPAPAAGVF